MRKLLLTLALALCASTAIAQNIYLVAVGVKDYPGTRNDLTLPEADAKAIAELYRKNSRAKTTLLLNEKATRTNVMKAMEQSFSQAKEDDIIVLFFSGHGQRGTFCTYPSNFEPFLRYSDIKNVFAKSKSKHKMVFADACHSGDFRSTTANAQDNPQDMDVMLFLSSRQNEQSLESPRMQNGFFTSSLIQALKGGADANRDRAITAKELFNAVSKDVVQKTSSRQHPVMWGHFDDNMIVMKW